MYSPASRSSRGGHSACRRRTHPQVCSRSVKEGQGKGRSRANQGGGVDRTWRSRVRRERLSALAGRFFCSECRAQGRARVRACAP
eukprot:6199157-Pleurochrysis_carterae.AAC.6